MVLFAYHKKPMKVLIHRFLGFIKIIKSLRFKDTYKDIGRCDVILCCSDSDRTEKYEGLKYSRIADSLAEELSKEGVSIQRFAWPYSRLVGRKAWGYAYSANRRFFRNLLWNKCRRVFGFKSAAESMEIDFYARLISQTGARSLVGIGLPSTATKAARNCGIKSVELLHGYGYSSLPWGWDSAPRDALPEAVIAFDDLSAKTFGALAAKGMQVSRIENLWYRKFRDIREFNRLPESWRRDQKWIPNDKKVILVSMSWGYDGDHGPYTFFAGVLKNGLFPDELVEAIKMVGENYYWIFRLHPVQMQSERSGRYKKILNDLCDRFNNCEWAVGTKVPLPLLLKRCHAHISMVSMTAYDAAFMGVRSLMLCPTLRPGGANELMFSDLKMQNYVDLGTFDAAAIVLWLQAAGPLRAQLRDDVLVETTGIKALLL